MVAEDAFDFNIRRSCLSEISIMRKPKELSIVGFR